jgi:DNA-binding NtrC family response regulator
MLAKYFCEKFCRDLKKKALTLAPSAIDDLMVYAWPGNVRELQNCIERAVILTEGDTIHSRHLNLSFREIPAAARAEDSPWARIDLAGPLAEVTRRTVVEVERRKLDQALKDAAGSKNRAADLLQIPFKTLVSKLREHGLE